MKDMNEVHEAFIALDEFGKLSVVGELYFVARHLHDDKDMAMMLAGIEEWNLAFERYRKIFSR